MPTATATTTDADADPADPFDTGQTISESAGPNGVVTKVRLPDGSIKTITAGPDGVETIVTGGPSGKTVVAVGDRSVGVTKRVDADGIKTVTITADRDEEPAYVGYDSHRGWNGPPAWAVIIGLLILAGIIKSAIRARGGDTRTRRERRMGVPAAGQVTATREAELLAAENERLRAQVVRMEERVAVLERIVTEPGRRVSEEIDRLR